MALTKVLITVKTYPTLSVKYDELVCTAGFKEDGTWIRIYPIQFRKLDYESKYRKYEWIEINLEKNTSDFRPESYRPHDLDTQPIIHEKIGTKNFWEERKKICLGKVYDDLEVLIQEAKDSGTSLATFKPTKIYSFVYEKTEREWDKAKLDAMQQMGLFESIEDKKFDVVKKLPYKFSYTFEDTKGRKSKLMIEDWEVAALYWNCLRKAKEKYTSSEEAEGEACMNVKQKYFTEFTEKHDLYFFLGTTLKFHQISLNPFIIIGTFHPMKDTNTQQGLF